MLNVISYSGGKDSTALLLWAIRIGLQPRRVVFSDTGWEHPETLRYIANVERWTGERIESVHGPETFIERVTRLRGFPTPQTRWCTRELKIEPTAAWLDRVREETGDDVQVLVGVRREESAVRKDPILTPEREWSKDYDCEVWRPLLDWELSDVIVEHERANIPLNPLYRLGAERVGCWPCIQAGKSEIRLVSEIDPERIDLIREVERITKNTMFAREAPVSERIAGEKRHELPLPIDEAVAWARTERGGRQITLFRAPSGCARWGICEQVPEEGPC